jgi:hypothetical protein
MNADKVRTAEAWFPTRRWLGDFEIAWDVSLRIDPYAHRKAYGGARAYILNR